MNEFISLSSEERKKQRGRFIHKKCYKPDQYLKILTPYLNSHENLTFAEYATQHNLNNRQMLLLRHDIDHDYETALRIATWEHNRGLKSTYCVLHSTWYYGNLVDGCYRHTDELVRLCRELAAMGHEINLHNNFVVVALQMGLDPVKLLSQELAFLRGLNLEVTGTSTHGDPLCRKINFRNYEIFSEAVSKERGGARTLHSPIGNVKLGAITMPELELNYEAYDIARDIYITDSGGDLRTSHNVPGRQPFGRTDQSNGQVVAILTHPIWWDYY